MANAYEPARIPTNEDVRVAAVRRTGVLDTAQRDRFKVYVDLAREVAQCPVAYTGLLDEERQYYMAHSFPASMNLSEMPRPLTFCQYSLLDTRPIVVRDLREHPKFKDHPKVVASPHFVFWAGFPLVTQEGLVMGTLCVVDFEPRDIAEEKIELLTELADNLTLNLELQAMQREYLAPRMVKVIEVLDKSFPKVSLAAVSGFLKLCCGDRLTGEEKDLVTAMGLAELDVYDNPVLSARGREIQSTEGLTSAVYKRRKRAVINSHNVDELFDLLGD